nr:MAG TPA: hypothetical protein [Caudoviricetes sp.]
MYSACLIAQALCVSPALTTGGQSTEPYPKEAHPP